MASGEYLTGRRKYRRPQAMLWSENDGTLIEYPESSGSYIHVPVGYEIGADTDSVDPDELNQFLILSDDNRQPIDFSIDRIENRQRMINGRMRSYHIADKRRISVSWDNLPSRSYYTTPDFNTDIEDDLVGKSLYYNQSGLKSSADLQYTTDGGAGGVELLDWYNTHTGSFFVYLSYDNYKNFSTSPYQHLQEYNEVIEVFFSDFSYSIVKRGGSNYDFWSITAVLEEV